MGHNRQLSDILANLPEVKPIAGVRLKIHQDIQKSGKRLVVVDDDPTGTQTVHNVSVYTDWSTEQLRSALDSEDPVFYISINSRSLSPEKARKLNYQLGQNLLVAAKPKKTDLLLASRSDSTLRGHFPDEVSALMEGFNQKFDGIILVPALFEAGRYTIDDIQWVDYGNKVLSAEQTEFAQDPFFGYKYGNLKFWVEEKTGGKVKANEIRSISIETIRKGGPSAIAEELIKAGGGVPVVVNSACYEDLEIFVLGLLSAEASGKRFIYRCAASFVKVRGGFQDKAFLTKKEIEPGDAPGLIVVGSYVEKTTDQVSHLLQSGIAVGVEVQVDNLLRDDTQDREIKDVTKRVDGFMKDGLSVLIYTSRKRKGTERGDFLDFGSVIMNGLCEVIRRIKTKPGFLIAKGGITSMEVARLALGVKRARVLGQIAQAIPVWRMESESRWPGMPYIVFPGNVGSKETLSQIVKIIQGEKGT